MLSRSTLLHLRIPFSFFLMPVFWFAVSLSGKVEPWRIVLIFLILHLLLYPASNGYNSYFDKDEDSIGGLRHPPKVSLQLYWISLVLDGLALLLGLLLGIPFWAGLFLYGLASKAYSHNSIRLKKYPVTSWLIAGFFQGAFTFLMVYQALTQRPLSALLEFKVLFPALLSSLLLWGFYPMTQVYQHAEDARRGDMTMSRMLGIQGTFVFTALCFGMAMAGFYYFFQLYYPFWYFLLFQLCLAPGLVFFLYWFLQVRKDDSKANFDAAMRLNLISSIGTNLFFILLGWLIA
jgi:4-hydroxybenzoate polyprenyltransferase